MNDWNNDNLKPGDLVQVWSPGQGLLVYNRPEVAMTGIVISLNKPPRGSLQIYDAQVLIEGHIVNVYWQNMHRITDDSGAASEAPSTSSTRPAGSPVRAHK